MGGKLCVWVEGAVGGSATKIITESERGGKKNKDCKSEALREGEVREQLN